MPLERLMHASLEKYYAQIRNKKITNVKKNTVLLIINEVWIIAEIQFKNTLPKDSMNNN